MPVGVKLSSAITWRNVAKSFYLRVYLCAGPSGVLALGCGRVVHQAELQLVAIGMFWANWSWDKPAAARRADVMQDGFHAFCTISAFIGANPGIGRLGRQITITPFTVGPEN